MAKFSPRPRGASPSPASLNAPQIVPKKAYTRQTNQKLIKLALQNVCLAGEPNRTERELVLSEMTHDTNYIILFKGLLGRQDYRALYRIAENGEITKVHGHAQAPAIVGPEMIETFWRYNSGAKEFAQLGGQKSITVTTDAVSLRKEYLPKKVPRL